VIRDELPFYNKYEDGKPVRNKKENIASWRFTRMGVYDWLVKKDYTDFKMEGSSLPPPVGRMDRDVPSWS